MDVAFLKIIHSTYQYVYKVLEIHKSLAWRIKPLTMCCTDHSPSSEGMLFGHDEIILLVRGGNYGWPIVIGDEDGLGLFKPLIHSGLETWAQFGCCIYRPSHIMFLKDCLLYAALRGKSIGYILLDDNGEKIVKMSRLLDKIYGRLRDVMEGPDGDLYVLTSNRDRRGNPTRYNV